jgi:ribosomal-protein-alanine N-acetyltransferase
MRTFQSDRLIYVPLSSEHADPYFLMESDPEVLKYYRREVAKDREEALNNLLVYVKYAMEHEGRGAWAVIAKDTAEFVGIGVIIHLEKNHQLKEHEVGYRLLKQFWGKGYATEIAKAMMAYGFDHLKLDELYATTHPDNLVSQRVLEKVGFVYTGDGPYHGGCKVYRLKK